MSGATYICNPGEPRGLTPEEAAAPCKCRHARFDHWWGAGPCGECSRCNYFRPRPAAATAAEASR